mgnify:CR=1 FL=1
MKYFFDTYAIIEIIRENKNYERYFEEEIVTSVLNLGELYYSLLREKGENEANKWHEKLRQTALAVNPEIIRAAMKFRHDNKNKNLSFIDCVGYKMAEEKGLVFLTGDQEFEGLHNVEFVK